MFGRRKRRGGYQPQTKVVRVQCSIWNGGGRHAIEHEVNAHARAGWRLVSQTPTNRGHDVMLTFQRGNWS